MRPITRFPDTTDPRVEGSESRFVCADRSPFEGLADFACIRTVGSGALGLAPAVLPDRLVGGRGVGLASWRGLAEATDLSETATRMGVFRRAFDRATARLLSRGLLERKTSVGPDQ